MKVQIIDYETGRVEERELTPRHPERPEYFIGRHSSCCLNLIGPDISRIHGRLQAVGSECYYSDLGSSGGSRINNAPIEVNQRYLLEPDDQIRIGSCGIVVREFEPTAGPMVTSSPTAAPKPAASTLEVVCKNIVAETGDVKTFTFTALEGIPFDYKPGQFVTLNLEIDGKPIKRSYSISSTPSRPRTLEITVKRVPPPADEPTAPAGLVSNWLHDNLHCGDRLRISAPMGQFTCFDKADEPLLLVSAGSGITPMMSMSRWLCDTARSTDIVFFHSARTPADIIFRQELELMAARHPNFKLAIATTRPSSGQGWAGYSGRLSATMLAAIAPDFRDRVVYVCGPDPFMQATEALFADLGLPKDRYNQESFGVKPKKRKPAPEPAASVTAAPTTVTAKVAPTPVAAVATPATTPAPAEDPIAPPATSGTPAIEFSLTGREISYTAEESILDVAEREGIEIDSGCRMGACGACKVKLLAGEVAYAGEEPDCEPGCVYTCVAVPVGTVKIEA